MLPMVPFGHETLKTLGSQNYWNSRKYNQLHSREHKQPADHLATTDSKIALESESQTNYVHCEPKRLSI